MAIYLWLDYIKEMISFESHEEFADFVKLRTVYNSIPFPEEGHIIMIEKNTKQWME